MRDIHAWFKDLEYLKEDLSDCSWQTYKPPPPDYQWDSILDDLKWRATHLGLTDDFKSLPDFWAQIRSDMPWQLTEGLAMSSYGPLDGLRPTIQRCDGTSASTS